MGGPERGLDEVRPEFTHQKRVAVGLAVAVVGSVAPLVRDDFVDNVPCGDAALIACDGDPDVAEHLPAQLLCRQALCHPRRHLVVPDQRVALDSQPVPLAKSHELVGLVPEPLSPLRLQ